MVRGDHRGRRARPADPGGHHPPRPRQAEADRLLAETGLRLDIALTQASDLPGPVPITGLLDLADARDLEEALRKGAAELKDLGSEESLDVRRARAAPGG